MKLITLVLFCNPFYLETEKIFFMITVCFAFAHYLFLFFVYCLTVRTTFQALHSRIFKDFSSRHWPDVKSCRQTCEGSNYNLFLTTTLFLTLSRRPKVKYFREKVYKSHQVNTDKRLYSASVEVDHSRKEN